MHLSPHWGLKDPSGVQLSLYLCMCLSVHMSVAPSVTLSHFMVVRITFWQSKRVVRNCTQRMRPQASCSNPLSGSIICPFVCLSVCPSVRPSVHPSVRLSVRPSGCPRAFLPFCICINFQCGGPASRYIYSTLYQCHMYKTY